jgi:hypothetical protein
MIPKTIKLDIPEVIEVVHYLSSDGKLAISNNNLVYLDIDDGYIHQLLPPDFSVRHYKFVPQLLMRLFVC